MFNSLILIDHVNSKNILHHFHTQTLRITIILYQELITKAFKIKLNLDHLVLFFNIGTKISSKKFSINIRHLIFDANIKSSKLTIVKV